MSRFNETKEIYARLGVDAEKAIEENNDVLFEGSKPIKYKLVEVKKAKTVEINMFDFDYSFTSKGNMRVYEIPAARHKFDISLRKSFLKDALSLELKGTDLFRTKSFTSIYRGPYMIVQSNLTDSRQVVLTLRYKFNSAKSKYKGTGAGEQQKNRF